MDALDFKRRNFLRALLSLGVGFSPRSSWAAEPIAVVVTPGSKQRELSSDQLRRIFLAIPSDDEDGHRFVPINLGQTSSVRERFDRVVLKMSPEEIARYWIDQRLRGSKPPRSASSVELVRRVVQELPGAISYLPLSVVGPLRVLQIDGHSPQDAAYLLR